MCGRYFLEASIDEIEALVGTLVSKVRLQPRYNIAPEQPIPVVRNDAMGKTHLDFVR